MNYNCGESFRFSSRHKRRKDYLTYPIIPTTIPAMFIANHKLQLTNNKIFKVSFFIFVCILVFGCWNLTEADASGCVPIYGGGPTCTDNSLSVHEEVLNPNTNKYVHNLGKNDNNFKTNDQITFRITLTNNSNNPIQKIIVKDTIPSILNFINGPGNYNKSNGLLTFTPTNLAEHKSESFTIKTMVNSQNDLANNCLINSVSALPSSGSIVGDSSQFCLGNLNTTPATGPEAIGLLTLLPGAFVGFIFQRLANKSI